MNLIKLFLDKARKQIHFLKNYRHMTMRLKDECRLILVQLKSNQLEMLDILFKFANHFEEVGKKSNVIYQFGLIHAEMGALRKRMLDARLAN